MNLYLTSVDQKCGSHKYLRYADGIVVGVEAKEEFPPVEACIEETGLTYAREELGVSEVGPHLGLNLECSPEGEIKSK